MGARRRYRAALALLLAAAQVTTATPVEIPVIRERIRDAPAKRGSHSLITPILGAGEERVTRLRLGDPDAPAPGVERRAAPSPGRSGGRGQALVLRRDVTPGFAAVGVTWAAREPHAEVSVAVRVRRAGGWTGWRAAAHGEEGPGGERASGERAGGRGTPGQRDRRRLRDGAELQWWGPADGIEVAVGAAAGAAPRDVAVDLIDPGHRPGDEAEHGSGGDGSGDDGSGDDGGDRGPGAGERAGGPERSARAAPFLRQRVPMPPVVRRAGWGADESKMGWTPEYVPHLRAAAVHHTATTNAYTRRDVPRILRSIYHFHAVSRGWGDIGYNVIVDRFGRLWEGRSGGLSRPVVGAHSGGYNSYTTGVAFLGDHRTRPVPARSREAAARFLAWKFSLSPGFDPRGRTRLTGGGSTSRYPYPTTLSVFRIHGHRRTNATTCPGRLGGAALDPLRRRTFALMGIWTRPTALRGRLSVWRASTATWHVRGVRGPLVRGARGDVAVAADFDGDGTTDLTTWTPATGRWVIRNSASRTVRTVVLGGRGQRPVPADTDGDGRAEPMTWDPETGLWHRLGAGPVYWGALPDDIPVPADYDGDGRADLAVWRPSTGGWHVRGMPPVTHGDARDRPVPADYDGDGAAEPAVWSPRSHRFHVLDRRPRRFGLFGRTPVPGQYDGDAPAELAVWGEGRWLIEDIGFLPMGTQGDQPIPVS